MANPISLFNYVPLGLQRREISASVVGWGGYMVVLSCYCTLYQALLMPTPPDFIGSLVWAVREWIVWLLITPLVFKSLRRNVNGSLVNYLRIGSIILIATVSFRVSVDVLTDTRSAVESAMIFVPRYIAAVAVVLSLWHIYLLKSLTAQASRPSAPAPLDPPADEKPESKAAYPSVILVSKGSDQCLLQINKLECVVAARNYVELFADGDQPYLLRMTMSDVQALLPPADFVRIHRSHIVNIHAIERIKRQSSGNDLVRLRSGRELNIGRKFKEALDQFDVIRACSD